MCLIRVRSQRGDKIARVMEEAREREGGVDGGW